MDRRTLLVGMLAAPLAAQAAVPLVLRFLFGQMLRRPAVGLASSAARRGFVRATTVRTASFPSGLLLSETVAAAMSQFDCGHLVVRGSNHDMAVEANRAFSENLRVSVEDLGTGAIEASVGFYASASAGIFTFQLTETELPYQVLAGPKRLRGEVVRSGSQFFSPNFYFANTDQVAYEQ